jgi:hypothetical protein
MDGIGGRRTRRRHDAGDVEQIDGPVSLGLWRDRADPEPFAGARDARGDLAAIRDEKSRDPIPGLDEW